MFASYMTVQKSNQLFNPISTGGGVFHVKFVCLLITFLVLGRLPPNLVTFPKNYHSRGAWKKI